MKKFQKGIVVLIAFGLVLSSCGTPDTPEVETIVVHFGTLPDGTPVTTDLFLAGDEFGSQGVTLAGSPGSEEFADPPYCPDASAVAIHKPPQVGEPNFLTAVSPGEIDHCNTIPIEITFISPVHQVTLTFFGASTTYTLQAYDTTGTLLGEVQQDAVFEGGTFEITFSSGSTNISRVVFGHIPVRPEPALTAITEISYPP